jgi:hypothetical protein
VKLKVVAVAIAILVAPLLLFLIGILIVRSW